MRPYSSVVTFVGDSSYVCPVNSPRWPPTERTVHFAAGPGTGRFGSAGDDGIPPGDLSRRADLESITMVPAERRVLSRKHATRSGHSPIRAAFPTHSPWPRFPTTRRSAPREASINTADDWPSTTRDSMIRSGCSLRTGLSTISIVASASASGLYEGARWVQSWHPLRPLLR